jgi:N6-adenosine-specific RNA methylase IME4
VSFRVLCADPPWSFGDKLPGKTRGAEKNYDVMSLDGICRMELPPLEPDALLFLWRVSSQVKEAYRVVDAWGFDAKTEIVWQKLTPTGKKHFGMGRYVRACHETCIVARKGRPEILAKNIRSTFEAPTGSHSEKPEFFYREIVEKLSAGPYCELFARKQREGWTCLGNQVGLLGAA